MSNKVIVHKNRANTTQVHVGYDISTSVITSEIRTEPDVNSTLIFAWEVSFLTDGTDGKLILYIGSDVASQVVVNSGYMDLKQVPATGDPVAIFDEPLEVSFRGVVTQ